MTADSRERRDGAWWRTAAVYQVYPRSFADGDGDGVGDLRGLIERLGHLAGGHQALGVDAVWLTPFYPSGGIDGGYDVTDYTAVDPALGTIEDFDELLAEAHRRELKVIVDWVPNHTSDRHPWFQRARRSRDDPQRDWYVWADGRGDGPPNNWLSAFDDVGPAWTRDDGTGQWYLHSFSPHQPDLNWDNPEVEQAMHDVLRFWLARGVDGFRIDVAQCLGKDPRLGDNPWPITKPTPEAAGRRHDEDWPSVFDRLAGIRRVVDEYPERMLVGEVYVLDQARLAEYVKPGRLHLVHNFTFVRQDWSAEGFRAVVDEFETALDDAGWPAWFLNNHDHSRAATRFGADGFGAARARLAATMLLTLRGTPFLFQGEELGLADSPIDEDAVVDVDGRDPVRTPMPWENPAIAGPGAGFTRARPWLPLPPEAEGASVADQLADASSALSHYRALLRLRRDSPALRLGSYRPLDAPADVYAYLREHGDETVLVALNFSRQMRRLPLPSRAERLVLSTDPHRSPGPAGTHLELEPLEGAVLTRSNQSSATASKVGPLGPA